MRWSWDGIVLLNQPPEGCWINILSFPMRNLFWMWHTQHSSNLIAVERVMNTSMENGCLWILGKNENTVLIMKIRQTKLLSYEISRHIWIHLQIQVWIQWKNTFSIISNLQTNHRLKLDLWKVVQHTEGKWCQTPLGQSVAKHGTLL